MISKWWPHAAFTDPVADDVPPGWHATTCYSISPVFQKYIHLHKYPSTSNDDAQEVAVRLLGEL